ncbi:hypothetical protein C8R44DRAFT_818549 [Mycena epipterygia]|nr:hypothetical protein C8R44DRAFT_818549 [Mycena epipterygia]
MTAQGYNPITACLLCVASALCAPPLLSILAPPLIAVVRLHIPASALRAPRPAPHLHHRRSSSQTPSYLSSPSPCSSFRLGAGVHSHTTTGVPRRTPEMRCCP